MDCWLGKSQLILIINPDILKTYSLCQHGASENAFHRDGNYIYQWSMMNQQFYFMKNYWFIFIYIKNKKVHPQRPTNINPSMMSKILKTLVSTNYSSDITNVEFKINSQINLIRNARELTERFNSYFVLK